MQSEQIAGILALLETIGKGMEYLQSHEDAKTARAVLAGRRSAALQIEQALGDTLTKRISADALCDAEWLSAMYRIVEQLADPFEPANAFDREFLGFIQHIWNTSEDELLQQMKRTLNEWKKTPDRKGAYQGFVDYFARFPLWGTLHPERGDFDTLRRRAAVLKRHSYDFLWLCRRLDDYLSKRTLTAILSNWAVLDLAYPQTVKSIFPDYWEPDIFPDNRGMYWWMWAHTWVIRSRSTRGCMAPATSASMPTRFRRMFAKPCGQMCKGWACMMLLSATRARARSAASCF